MTCLKVQFWCIISWKKICFIRDILSTFFSNQSKQTLPRTIFLSFSISTWENIIVVSSNPENNVLRVYWHATVALSVIECNELLRIIQDRKDSLTFLTRTNEIQSKPPIIIHNAVPLRYYYRSSTVISNLFPPTSYIIFPINETFPQCCFHFNAIEMYIYSFSKFIFIEANCDRSKIFRESR